MTTIERKPVFVRLLSKSLYCVLLSAVIFGSGAAKAFYYELDYGVDAGSASAQGVVSSCNSIHLCVADIKSLGVILEVSVSSSGTSIMMIGSSKKLGIRDCCLFGDGERIVSFDADAPLTKLPFAGQLERTGELQKIGVLYLRILKSRRLRPRTSPWNKQSFFEHI
jgi:hypothetical protein